MNLFAIAGLSCAICSLISVGITLLSRKNVVHRTLTFLNIAVVIWSSGLFLVGIAGNEKDAIFGWKFAHIGGIFISILFFHLVCLFCEIKRTVFLIFGYTQAIVFNLVSWGADKLITKTRYIYGFYYNDVTFIFILAVVAYLILVFASFRELIIFLKSAKGNKRMQSIYLLTSYSIGFIGGTSTFLPEFKIDIFYPLGAFGVALYAVILSYAILRYRLLDIKIIATRTGIFIFVYLFVLGLPFALAIWAKSWLIALFAGAWWVIPLGTMAFLATLGPFIYIFLERRAEAQLLKEQRRYQQTLKQASIGMVRIRNLQKLLELMTHIITKTVRISHAAVYLYDQQNNEYKLQVSRDKRHSFIPLLAGTDPLIAWLLGKHDPIIYEEIKRRSEENDDLNYKNVAESMQRLSASVIIPSFLEYRLTGFIVLGDKLSGQVYTPDDLNVFQVLATQAALAIENAQFYEEAKTMQEQIAQAEKMATVGTMADGLSHQINNRFYALSLIASDTIDTIRMTDTSQCTPEVQTMITEINKALERIQSNVMQGGEVVKGILKYTRKGEEGFEPLSLDQILDGTLAMIQYKIRLSEIDIVREYPQGAAQIHGNLVQMQEVFFNFIDNAYDSIMERRSILKEEGYRGRITITLKAVKDSMAVIHIADNGMGVKESNARKLFTPFFTTKTSSRKGTGLGLYVIRRIITEMHNGRIHFESEYQRGTRFIIELPVTNHTPVANHSVV